MPPIPLPKDYEKLSLMPTLKGYGPTMSTIEGKGFKILTRNKLLTRLSALLVQTAQNNSYKFKKKQTKTRLIIYLLYQYNNHQKAL